MSKLHGLTVLSRTRARITQRFGQMAAHDRRSMSEPAEKLDVLVIQFWIHDLSPIAAALRDAEVDARIRRVDIEPAFRAALDRQAWQLVIYDPKAPLSIKLVRSTMRACRCQAFLIIADDPTALGDRIREASWARSC